jgi:hypothetical protein
MPPRNTGAMATASVAITRAAGPPPKSAASARGEHDDRAAGQRRQDPDSGGIHDEQVSGAGEQHGERRLVHVPERQVVTRHEKVQLVLLEAVPVAGRQFTFGVLVGPCGGAARIWLIRAAPLAV